MGYCCYFANAGCGFQWKPTYFNINLKPTYDIWSLKNECIFKHAIFDMHKHIEKNNAYVSNMLNICIFTIAVGCIIYMHIIYTNETWNTYCIYNCTVTLHWQQILFYVYTYIYIHIISYSSQTRRHWYQASTMEFNQPCLERRIKKSSGISRFPTHWDLRTCGSCWRSNSCSQCQVAPIRWEKCEKTSERKNICQKIQGSQHENSCKMAQHSKNTSSVKQLSKQLHVTNNLHHSNIFHFFLKGLSYFFIWLVRIIPTLLLINFRLGKTMVILKYKQECLASQKPQSKATKVTHQSRGYAPFRQKIKLSNPLVFRESS